MACIESARRVATARSASAAASKGLDHATNQLEMMQPQQAAMRPEQQPSQHKSVLSNGNGRPTSQPTSPPATDTQGLQDSDDTTGSTAGGTAGSTQGSSTAQTQPSQGACTDNVVMNSPASRLADQDSSVARTAALRDDDEQSDSGASDDSLAGLGGFSDVLSSWMTASAPQKQKQHPYETNSRQPLQNSSTSMPSPALTTLHTAHQAGQGTDIMPSPQSATQVPSVRPLPQPAISCG